MVWSMVDMWPLRGLGVCYGSTNQANSAFHPFGVSKWVVISVIAWITEVTIKRQARTVCGCSALRLDCVCWLSLQPVGCTICPSLWRTALWSLQLPLVALYKCYAFIFTFYLTVLLSSWPLPKRKCLQWWSESTIWQVWLSKVRFWSSGNMF